MVGLKIIVAVVFASLIFAGCLTNTAEKQIPSTSFKLQSTKESKPSHLCKKKTKRNPGARILIQCKGRKTLSNPTYTNSALPKTLPPERPLAKRFFRSTRGGFEKHIKALFTSISSCSKGLGNGGKTFPTRSKKKGFPRGLFRSLYSCF